MRVSNPDDAGEQQAEAVANEITGRRGAPRSRPSAVRGLYWPSRKKTSLPVVNASASTAWWRSLASASSWTRTPERSACSAPPRRSCAPASPPRWASIAPSSEPWTAGCCSSDSVERSRRWAVAFAEGWRRAAGSAPGCRAARRPRPGGASCARPPPAGCRVVAWCCLLLRCLLAALEQRLEVGESARVLPRALLSVSTEAVFPRCASSPRTATCSRSWSATTAASASGNPS